MNSYYVYRQYEIIDFEQGTGEWRSWRNDFIGSSDAPVIMSESPYKSVRNLLDEKLGLIPQFSGNDKTRLGQKLEPEARERYSDKVGIIVEPVVLRAVKNDWQIASIDGFSESHRRVVEIKCGEGAYFSTRRSGKVPSYYYGQLQHILAVTGYPSIDFFCYWPSHGEILITVKRNDEYIDNLIYQELSFLKRLRSEKNILQTKEGLSEPSAKTITQRNTSNPRQKKSNQVLIGSEEFDSIRKAADFYGVRVLTIENWLHWLRFLPENRKSDLLREIEIRKLDYQNGVIGTEAQEEKKANALKNKVEFLGDYFTSYANAAKAYGVKNSTITSWSRQLLDLSGKKRRFLVAKIKKRLAMFSSGKIGTEKEELKKKADIERVRAKKQRQNKKEAKVKARVAAEAKRVAKINERGRKKSEENERKKIETAEIRRLINRQALGLGKNSASHVKKSKSTEKDRWISEAKLSLENYASAVSLNGEQDSGRNWEWRDGLLTDRRSGHSYTNEQVTWSEWSCSFEIIKYGECLRVNAWEVFFHKPT